ncbi:hypothetical protein ACFSFY_00605 [Sporosarcina siberiensis]|uniref:Type II secretion system protein n=1 Tax=Sporosarcina siberiensis TaxID=1365606 RepID=A0ABW4SB27_9BACL
MNEKGYSWPEAMLTLLIVLIVFGTLLPLATKTTSFIHAKKQLMRAAETAYHGSILYKAYRIDSGTHTIEDLNYDWKIDDNSVCVSYLVIDKEEEKCVDY